MNKLIYKAYHIIRKINSGSRFIPWILLAITATCLLYAACPFQRQHIGVVNISGIVDEFIKNQAKAGLSPEELKKNVKTFGASLEKVMHDISAKENVVLMPAEAVISGAKDYTQEVQQLLPLLPVSKPLRSSLLEERQQLPKATSQELSEEWLHQKTQQLEQRIQEKNQSLQVQPVASDTRNKTSVIRATTIAKRNTKG